MKKLNSILLLTITFQLCFFTIVKSEESGEERIDNDTTQTIEFDSTMIAGLLASIEHDSIAEAMTYQYGTIELGDGIAKLTVPKGFKYLDPEQSNTVLTTLWGNPPAETYGLLFLEDQSPLSENFSYAVEISYSAEGYIKDDDAEDINYEELLEEMQSDIEASNPERIAQGYPSYQLIGWASTPFYDAENKKLHWAKELLFEGYDVPTLNYDIRILGRKGMLSLNVIGDMDALPLVKQDINKILESTEFTKGNQYSDFDPDIDEIAAYGIGGLIAGKLLLKAGFFAKFWKLILLGGVGLVAGIKKFFGKNKDA